VPGCGSAHDGVFLADAGFKVTAIDISEAAVLQARKMLDEVRRRSRRSAACLMEHGLLSQFPPMIRERMQVLCEDFFAYSPPSKFNLIYDYVFFCALPPDLRQQWARKMAELLDENGASSLLPAVSVLTLLRSLAGELVTIIFPVDQKMDADKGPPYPVTLNMYKYGLCMCVSCALPPRADARCVLLNTMFDYRSVLTPAGFSLVYSQLCKYSTPARMGREVIARWILTPLCS
jgi:hypothetical protein